MLITNKDVGASNIVFNETGYAKEPGIRVQ